MLIQFENGWQLQVIIYTKSNKKWYLISHSHPPYKDNKGNSYTGVVTMEYHHNKVCRECGGKVPNAVKGTVKLINWSMENVDSV